MLKKIIISLGHSLILLFLHLIYFNLNWSLPLEYEIMMMMNKTESFLGGHGRYDKKNYLFINTAYDQVLINAETEYNDTGTLSIADRKLLSQFFEKISESGNHHKYILCDLFFDASAPGDSIFINAINKVTKIIIPTEFDKKKKQLIKPIVNVKAAQADYVTYEGLVSKIRLYAKDSKTKTLPLIMYEDCNSINTRITRFGLFYKKSYIPQSIYPRYFYERETIKPHEFRLKQVVDMLQMNNGFVYENVLKNRVIVIGDFNKDRHSTFVGSMPGSLVLFNTYLTLESGFHMLEWSWVLFAIVAFGALCFFEFQYIKKRKINITQNWPRFFLHLLGLSGRCILISLLSGIIFGVHITIIPVIIYLEAYENLNRLFRLKKIA